MMRQVLLLFYLDSPIAAFALFKFYLMHTEHKTCSDGGRKRTMRSIP